MILEYILAMLMSVLPHSPIKAKATYYSPKFEGHKMANGRPYHAFNDAIAFNTWPLGTVVKITNPLSGKSFIGKITDRKGGPGVDLSTNIFDMLELSRQKGSGYVIVEFVSKN